MRESGPRRKLRSLEKTLGRKVCTSSVIASSRSDVDAQEARRVGAQDRLARRRRNPGRALHELDRLDLAERKIRAEHDMARVDLGGELLQHVRIEQHGVVAEP